jgi:hypothetical protein
MQSGLCRPQARSKRSGSINAVQKNISIQMNIICNDGVALCLPHPQRDSGGGLVA